MSTQETRSNIPTMRFLCFGAGAIGTYIGGSLALAGHSVVFIERPEQAEHLRKSGLTLWLDQQPHRLAEPQIVTDLEMALPLGPFDAAILAVKHTIPPPWLKRSHLTAWLCRP